MLFILTTGKLPFFAEFEQDLYRKIKKAKYELPKTGSVELKDLIQRIFVVDPLKRITAAKILEHPWLAGHANNTE